MIAAVGATVICAIAVAFLVAAERARSARGRLRWKPLASAAFIAVPVVGGALGTHAGDLTVARWVVAGLCLGAIGDVALMFEPRGFIGGLVAFLLGHLAYVAALSQIVALGHWLDGPLRIVVPLVGVAAAAVLRWLWPRLGALRLPVIAYVAVISAMLIGGFAATTGGDGALVPPSGRTLLTAGAVAFYLSDLAVARDKFIGHDPLNRTIGLPLYYGAQLLFAWGIVVG